MKNMTIEKMDLDCVDDVLVIENLSFPVPWSRAAFVQELKGNRLARYVAAKADGRVVGYAGMWMVIDEAHITNIAVHPEYRGQGIGSKLLERLIEIALEEGVDNMTLEVRVSNEIAQGLYKKYGFSVMGIRKEYYLDNREDAFIMWKRNIKSSFKKV